MKCPNIECNHIIPDDSKFCPDCGTEIKKYSSDIISTFLSLGGITLGKSYIYEVEASEYVKEDNPEFGKTIRAKTEDCIDYIASAKDKIVYAFIIKDICSFDLPESWKKLKIDKDNLSLSLEMVLGKNGFEWEDLENSGTSRGFAFKKANKEKYLTFVIEEDDALVIALLDDEQKSSLYANLQADNYIDDEVQEEDDEEELPCCPNCGSYDVDDDYSDYLQYTCNKCGHNWGHDDTVECPECGSNDVENDGTDYQQYTCNDCAHVWGDDEEEDYENEDDYGNSLANYFEVSGVILHKSTKQEVQALGGKLVDSKYGEYKLLNGISVFFYNNDKVVNGITLVRGDASFPDFFKSIGLHWEMDKEDFRNLFENLGFSVREDVDLGFVTASKFCNKYHTTISIQGSYINEYYLFDIHFY